MVLSISSIVLLCLLFFVIALFYSSIGFGGGSSYLALLALFALSFFTIRSMALVCNIVVVSGSTYWFLRKGHFNLKQFLPFIVASVPAAYLGASYRLEEQLFFFILGAVLMCSSVFLIWQTNFSKKWKLDDQIIYPAFLHYIIGGVIGFISGLVGIGGGIFLAPVLHHLKWGTPIKIAALASFFILVNSISGLSGLMMNGTLHLPLGITLGLVGSVFLGGQMGVRFSLARFSPKRIKQLTAFLVFMVGLRILIQLN